MYAGILAAFSQNTASDSAYKSRRLSFEEASLVSSYYHQDGNNAAVTGGIGSEKLSDLSNSFMLKLHKYDTKGRKHTFTGELGIDHYTSASSDKIDPSTISSASHADTRFYPSLAWSMENEIKGSTVGGGLSFSNEFDYTSVGANVNVAKKTKNKSGEFSANIQGYLDRVTLIYPIELRSRNNGEDDDYGSAPRNSISGTLSWSQIINQNFQVMIEGGVVYQNGYLGLPFHRVYFNDNSVHIETLPSTRLKFPLGFRANYFLGDRLILRTWYRNYNDNWGIHSNAVQLETSFKATPFFSIIPFYRFYQQTAADYFSPYGVHTAADEFYTSNYDLSKFNSNFFGAGFRIAPPEGVFKLRHLSSLEVRYGHYQKSTGMNSNIVSLNINVK